MDSDFFLILIFFYSSISGSTYDGSYARPRIGNKPIDPLSAVVVFTVLVELYCMFSA
jgi:hypothetical protein